MDTPDTSKPELYHTFSSAELEKYLRELVDKRIALRETPFTRRDFELEKTKRLVALTTLVNMLVSEDMMVDWVFGALRDCINSGYGTE